MTQNEAIYELRDLIRNFNLFDQDRLDDRHLKQFIINERSTWLYNQLSKGANIDTQIVQTVCMALQVADRSMSPSFTTGYNVLRTTLELPKVIEIRFGDGIISVGPVDRLAFPFSYVPIEQARVSGNGRFNQNMIFVFREQQYFYAISKYMHGGSFAKYMRYINVRAIFEDPEEASRFAHIDGTSCYSEDDEYPINRWMWRYIKNQIFQADFSKLIANAPTDKVNDATETLSNE